jgi:hypothetical protein
MGLYDKRPCPCGSGKMSQWLTDARGIPVKRVCPACEHLIMEKYRPQIFTNSKYEASEPIEEEEEFIIDFNPAEGYNPEYKRKKRAKKAKIKRKPVKKCRCKK